MSAPDLRSTEAGGGGTGRPLRIGLAGAGMISHYHLVAWARLVGEAEVVALCDPDFEKAKRRAAEFKIAGVHTRADAMLAAETLDALDIVSPRETHVALVELAAGCGLKVICQKPLAPTLSDAEGLLRRLPGPLMVHENWRFRPWYRRLAEWLRAGDIGKVRAVDMSMFSSGLLPDEKGVRPALVRQPFMAKERRLMIAEVLIHHIDVVRWLFGPLRVVAARAARALPDVAGETDAALFFETGAGVPVTVAGSMAAPGFPSRTGDRLQVVGSVATALLQGTELSLLGPSPRHERFDFDAGYQASFNSVIAHFVASLRSGAAFETDARDNIETLRLVEHAYWAAGRNAI
jgi:predicted dehydrogenase